MFNKYSRKSRRCYFTSMEENIIHKIEILQLIESKYNIEIKDEEVENIITFEDLIKLIKKKK
jgi:acyl carrier protein